MLGQTFGTTHRCTYIRSSANCWSAMKLWDLTNSFNFFSKPYKTQLVFLLPLVLASPFFAGWNCRRRRPTMQFLVASVLYPFSWQFFIYRLKYIQYKKLTSNHERPTQASPISTTGARFETLSSKQNPKLARKYAIWVGCNGKNMGGEMKKTNGSLVRVRPRPGTRTSRVKHRVESIRLVRVGALTSRLSRIWPCYMVC